MRIAARREGRRLRLALAALAAVILAMACVGDASAALDFCPKGSGVGQCESPAGVAMNAETGDAYVADRGNGRAQVFDEEAGFKGTIGAALLSAPRAVAVDNDPSSAGQGNVYVLDGARVLKLSPAGTLLAGFGWGVADGSAEAQSCGPEATPPTVSCLAGIEGKGECQLGNRSQLAVGPGGVAYVADSALVGTKESEGFKGRVERFAPDGACEGEQTLFEGENRVLNAIAVDSEGFTYVANARQSVGIEKLDPGASTVCEITPGTFTEALAIEPASDRLYAAQSESKARGSGSYRVVSVFEPGAGCPVARRFGYTEIENTVRGLAVFPGAAVPAAAGDALVSEGFGAAQRVFGLAQPPAGPLIVPGSAIASPVGNVNATLTAEINPEGAETEVSIEYIEQAECEANEAGGGECFEGAASSGTFALGAEGFSLQAAEAQIGCPDPLSEAGEPGNSCLTPETPYRFRVFASNPDGAGDSPQGGGFTSRPPVEFGTAWSTSVGTASAVLHAEANPLGIPAGLRFQIVDDAEYRRNGFQGAREVPAPGEGPLELGSGIALVARGAAVGGLAPATLYHYRPLVENPLIEPLAGPERTLTTRAAPAAPPPCPANEAFRTGPSALLPDCRAYELVSPLDKDNGDIIPLKGKLSVTPAVLVQSSLSGERFAYGSARAFGDAPSAPWTSQYVAARGAGGWQSHAISSPIGRPLYENAFANTESELKALSPDLCEAWVRTIADPPLAEGAQEGFPNLYRRGDEECGGKSYEALSTAAWRNVAEGSETALGLELQGLSANGEQAIFVAPDSLEGSGAPPSQATRLYAWSAATGPTFACVLPDRAALAGNCSGGYGSAAGLGLGRYSREQGALSANGERLFWTAGLGAGEIYMRQNPHAAESPRAHGAATGTATAIGPALAEARVRNGRTEVGNLEVLGGGFAPGQELSDSAGKIPPGTTVVSCSPDCLAPTALTLSQAASGTVLTDTLTGLPSSTLHAAVAQSGAFEAGQTISGPGIPAGARIEALAEEEGELRLTLSAEATETAIDAALSATSPCTGAATGACTIAVSAPGEALSGTSASEFVAAARDGSKALFRSGADLYEAQIGEAGGQLGVSATVPVAHEVEGVLGVSEDASHVYFASREAIAGSGKDSLGGEAQAGHNNLYLRDGGGYAFIGELSDQDVSTSFKGPVGSAPVENLARVAPDGEHAAFLASAPLTGYDNTDAGSGAPDTEVFLYDAAARRLVCASCNPSGARPAGRENSGEDKILFNGPRWMAAWIPGHETSLYASRELSEDGGRLFFTSTDALVARDTNGRADVYQWEAPGKGGCQTSSPTYSPRNGGCVDLISSGQSGRDAEFLDASPSGRDVFFTTLSSLVSQDYGLVNVYDARVDGGFAPPTAPPAGCEGEACQGQAAAPAASTPASAAFRGAGNAREAAAPRCRRPARRARSLRGRAGRLRRRAARAARNPRRARVLRRGAARNAKEARRQSARAKRCRARLRRQRRAGR